MRPSAPRGQSEAQASAAAAAAAHHPLHAALHERAIDLAFDSFFDDFMRAGPSTGPPASLRLPSPPRRFEALSAVPPRLRPPPLVSRREASVRAETLFSTNEDHAAALAVPPPAAPPPLAEGAAPAASQLHPWAPPDSLKQEPRSVSPSHSLAEEAAALEPPRAYDACLADDPRGDLVPPSAGPPLSPQLHVCVPRLGAHWTQHLARRMLPYHDGTALVPLPEPPETEYPPPTLLSYRTLQRRQARARDLHVPADLRRMWILRVAHHRGAIPPPPRGAGRVVLRRNLPGRKVLR